MRFPMKNCAKHKLMDDGDSFKFLGQTRKTKMMDDVVMDSIMLKLKFDVSKKRVAISI